MTLVLEVQAAEVHAPPAARICAAVSPELALVDPELAAAARALLPGPGQFRPAWKAQAPAPARPASPGQRAASEQTSGPHISHIRRAALVACALAAAATVGGVLEAIRGGGQETAQIPAAQAAAGAPHEAVVAREVREARTYTWPAVPGARTYEITLLRGREQVWSATTTATTAEFPARLRLAPGRYTWSATPAFGKSLLDAAARPVVEMTFQVV
jgi:hypothetical protein